MNIDEVYDDIMGTLELELDEGEARNLPEEDQKKLCVMIAEALLPDGWVLTPPAE